ncbi:MAG: hypothetical protein EAZ81_09050 [Verrucomicrobia bacterium]|jgi:hypothetical protein|nr:MAG: hypothetical protein EAZ81_09050 [Verrucomicrobiota bacterium]
MGMKRLICALLGLALVSCKKTPLEVTSTETRGITTKDGEVKLFASSDERFRGSTASPYADEAPKDWLARPASQFRLLNYAFGASGKGEVYVSVSQGTVLDNANRWRKQFALADLSQADLEKLPTVPLLGQSARWLEAKGVYASGMGKAPTEGFALAGLIAQVGGDIVTIKMVGPEDEVQAQQDALRQYAKTLRVRE